MIARPRPLLLTNYLVLVLKARVMTSITAGIHDRLLCVGRHYEGHIGLKFGN